MPASITSTASSTPAGEQLDQEGWLVLNNTDLSPDEAAARIMAAAGLNSATGRGAMTHSARGRIEISSGVVPRSCESARHGSGWWLVTRTRAARYVETCGA